MNYVLNAAVLLTCR